MEAAANQSVVAVCQSVGCISGNSATVYIDQCCVPPAPVIDADIRPAITAAAAPNGLAAPAADLYLI